MFSRVSDGQDQNFCLLRCRFDCFILIYHAPAWRLSAGLSCCCTMLPFHIKMTEIKVYKIWIICIKWMVQAIIWRSWREGGGLSWAQDQDWAWFSPAHCWTFSLLSLRALYQELSGPSLDRGNKTQTAWCVASDCSGLDLVMWSCDPLTPAQTHSNANYRKN